MGYLFLLVVMPLDGPLFLLACLALGWVRRTGRKASRALTTFGVLNVAAGILSAIVALECQAGMSEAKPAFWLGGILALGQAWIGTRLLSLPRG